MSRLDELQRSILEMTDEELKALYRDVRSERRVKKGKAANGTKRPGKAQLSMKDQARKLLAGMSQEERAALLKKIGA